MFALFEGFGDLGCLLIDALYLLLECFCVIDDILFDLSCLCFGDDTVYKTELDGYENKRDNAAEISLCSRSNAELCRVKIQDPVALLCER